MSDQAFNQSELEATVARYGTDASQRFFFADGAWINLSGYPTLEAAVQQSVQRGMPLVIDRATTQSSSALTITNHVIFVGVGSITVPTGKTLAINGPITAPVTQIFILQGTGTVTIGSPYVDAKIQWWGAKLDGATDDTAAIQAALVSLAGKKLSITANTIISSPLTIRSNTWLEVVPEATVSWNSSFFGNMLRNYSAANPQRTVSDAAITSGQTNLTSATANFTSSDIGRSVVVIGAGAGPGGPQAPTTANLYANITSVTNSTTAVVSIAAGTTVSGASCSIYDRDRNIKVTGGTWARNNPSGGAFIDKHSFFFRRVDGLTILDVNVTCTPGVHGYGIAPADVTDTTIERCTGSGHGALIQFGGPSQRVTLRSIYGTSTDDSVAFVARDYDGASNSVGDITEILVDGVYCTSGQALVKLLAGTGTKLRNIVLRNLLGHANTCAVLAPDDQTGSSDVGGLLIDGCNTILDTVGSQDIALTGTSMKDAIIRNLVTRVTTPGRSLISLGNIETVIVDGVQSSTALPLVGNTVVSVNGTVKNLTVKNVCLGGDQNVIVSIAGGQTANRVTISDSVLALTVTGNGRALAISGTVDFYKISNVSMVNGNNLFMLLSGAVAPVGQIDNCSLKGTGRVADLGTSSTDVNITNIVTDGLPVEPFFVDGSAALIIRGAGWTRRNMSDNLDIGFGGSWTGTIRVQNPDFYMNVGATGMTKTNGDICYNRNGGLACGLGKVISNGSNWKNIYTGNVF